MSPQLLCAALAAHCVLGFHLFIPHREGLSGVQPTCRSPKTAQISPVKSSPFDSLFSSRDPRVRRDRGGWSSQPPAVGGALTQGTPVYITDAQRNGVILGKDASGDYIIQVQSGGGPVLLKRRADDIHVVGPSRRPPAASEATSKPDGRAPFDETQSSIRPETQASQDSQTQFSTYQLYRDPQTGKPYISYARAPTPQLPKGGQRLRMAPPREALRDYLAQALEQSTRGAGSRRSTSTMPGFDFLRETFEESIRQHERRQQEQEQRQRRTDQGIPTQQEEGRPFESYESQPSQSQQQKAGDPFKQFQSYQRQLQEQWQEGRQALERQASDLQQQRPQAQGTERQASSRGAEAEMRSQRGQKELNALRRLAQAYLLNQQPEQAEEKLQEAQSKYRELFDSDMTAELAEAQHRQGKLNEAQANYRKALTDTQENARIALKYGVSLHDQGNPAAACQYYYQACQFDNKNTAAYNNLGVALQELGQTEAAIQCYRQALELDGLHAPALQNLAALTVSQGRFKLALACIQRALMLNPQDPIATQLATEVMQRLSAGRMYPQLPRSRGGRDWLPVYIDRGEGESEGLAEQQGEKVEKPEAVYGEEGEEQGRVEVIEARGREGEARFQEEARDDVAVDSKSGLYARNWMSKDDEEEASDADISVTSGGISSSPSDREDQLTADRLQSRSREIESTLQALRREREAAEARLREAIEAEARAAAAFGSRNDGLEGPEDLWEFQGRGRGGDLWTGTGWRAEPQGGKDGRRRELEEVAAAAEARVKGALVGDAEVGKSEGVVGGREVAEGQVVGTARPKALKVKEEDVGNKEQEMAGRDARPFAGIRDADSPSASRKDVDPSRRFTDVDSGEADSRGSRDAGPFQRLDMDQLVTWQDLLREAWKEREELEQRRMAALQAKAAQEEAQHAEEVAQAERQAREAQETLQHLEALRTPEEYIKSLRRGTFFPEDFARYQAKADPSPSSTAAPMQSSPVTSQPSSRQQESAQQAQAQAQQQQQQDSPLAPENTETWQELMSVSEPARPLSVGPAAPDGKAAEDDVSAASAPATSASEEGNEEKEPTDQEYKNNRGTGQGSVGVEDTPTTRTTATASARPRSSASPNRFSLRSSPSSWEDTLVAAGKAAANAALIDPDSSSSPAPSSISPAVEGLLQAAQLLEQGKQVPQQGPATLQQESKQQEQQTPAETQEMPEQTGSVPSSPPAFTTWQDLLSELASRQEAAWRDAQDRQRQQGQATSPSRPVPSTRSSDAEVSSSTQARQSPPEVQQNDRDPLSQFLSRVQAQQGPPQPPTPLQSRAQQPSPQSTPPQPSPLTGDMLSKDPVDLEAGRSIRDDMEKGAEASPVGKRRGREEVEMQAEQWQQAMDAWSELSRAAWGEPRDRAKVVGDVRRRKEEEEEWLKQREQWRQEARRQQDRHREQSQAEIRRLEMEERQAQEALTTHKNTLSQSEDELRQLKDELRETRQAALAGEWGTSQAGTMLSEAVEAEKRAGNLARVRAGQRREAAEAQRKLGELRRRRELLDQQQAYQQGQAQQREAQAQAWRQHEEEMRARRQRVERGLGLNADADIPGQGGLGGAVGGAEEGGMTKKVEGIPFMITRDMRRTLVEEMNYSHKEVNAMKPEEALDKIEKKLKKPPKVRRTFDGPVISDRAQRSPVGMEDEERSVSGDEGFNLGDLEGGNQDLRSE